MTFTGIDGNCSLRCMDWRNSEETLCKAGDSYHCMLSDLGTYGQICAPRIWIKPNSCPEYNTKLQQINIKLCNSRHGNCPSTAYLSDTVYQYPACFYNYINTADSTTTSSTTTNTGSTTFYTGICASADSAAGFPAWTLAVLSLIILALFITLLAVIWRWRIKERKDLHDEEEEPMILLEDDSEVQQHERDNTFYAGIEAVIDGWKTLAQYGVVILVGVTGAGKTKSGLELLSMVGKNNIGDRKYKSHILRNFDDIENIAASTSSPCILLDDCLERWNYSRVDPTIEDDVIRLENIFNKYIQKKGALVVLTLNAHTWERCSSFCEGRKFFRKQHIIWLESLGNKMEIEILEKHLCSSDIAEKPKKDKDNEISQGLKKSGTQDSVQAEKGNDPNEDFEKERRVVEKMMDTISKERWEQRYPQGFYRRVSEAYGLIWQAFQWKKACYLGFPGACAVFARDDKFWEMGEEFFKDPIDCLSRRFSEWRDSNVKTEREKYVVLVYMLMNGGQMDIRRINGALLYIAKSICNVDDDVSEDTVREGVAALARSYCVEKSPGFFVFQYEVIEYTLLSVAVFKHPRQIFENCDLNVLKRFMITKRNEKPEGELKLPVKSIFFDLLIKRFVKSRVNLVNQVYGGRKIQTKIRNGTSKCSMSIAFARLLFNILYMNILLSLKNIEFQGF